MTRAYLVSTVVGGPGFAPMIVQATDKADAAREAARIWTAAYTLFVVPLDDFEEILIERDPMAAATNLFHRPSVTHVG